MLIHSLLNWYDRQNIRLPIVVALIGLVGVISAAVVRGLFDLQTAKVQAPSRRKAATVGLSQMQPGSGNLQIGGDLKVDNSMNIQGDVNTLIMGSSPAELQKLRELASRDMYRPLDSVIREQVQSALVAARVRGPQFRIEIVAQQEGAARFKVADQLADLLASAGVVANAKKSVILTQGRFSIIVSFHPEDRHTS